MSMLHRLKLAPKFTILLLLVFILGSSIGGLVLSKALQHRAEDRITSEGIMLMESMRAVQRYTDEHISPILTTIRDTEDFWPEAVPAYSARRVFELLYEQGSDQKDFDFVYKAAVLNPTNPDDRVDDFEADLVNKFREAPMVDRLSGFREQSGRKLMFYSALPILIQDASCLRCHGVPEAAPAAMLSQYGRENGFGWELNKVIGTQIVYVPAEEVFQAANRAFSSVMGIFFGIFAIALLCLNALLSPLVVKPIQRLARLSQKLADDDLQSAADLPAVESQQLNRLAQRKDELGQLGRIFQTMVNEVVTRQQQLRQQIHELKIEIDEKRRIREVKEIVETDYFQSLQEKAKKIRDRRQYSK